MSSAIATQSSFLVPASIAEVRELADIIAGSELAPPNYRGKPDNCTVAILMGMDLGLSPMQALQNLSVINGRPSLWGDAVPAVIMQHHQFADMLELSNEQVQGLIRRIAIEKRSPTPLESAIIEDCKGRPTPFAVCGIQRRGRAPVVQIWTQEMAIKAGLWGKDVWAKYPDRMLKMKARSWASRDGFPDALRGIGIRDDGGDGFGLDPEKIVDASDPSIVQADGYLHEVDPLAELLTRMERANSNEDLSDCLDEAIRFSGDDKEKIRDKYRKKHAELSKRAAVPRAGKQPFSTPPLLDAADPRQQVIDGTLDEPAPIHAQGAARG